MPPEQDLYLERVPLDVLSEYPGNPRRGDVASIMLSLKKRGQYAPLIVSSDDVVLAGNHRLQAMRELGWDTGLIMRAVDPAGKPIHSKDAAAAEIVLVDNRTSDNGVYDDRALADLLGRLPDIDVAAVGYGSEDLDALLTKLEPSDGWGGHSDPTPPDDFNEYGDNIETAYGCPSCGYEWSGNPRPNGGTHKPPASDEDDDDDTDGKTPVPGANDGRDQIFSG